MCHDHDSRPPAPPRSGDVAERGVLTLTSADGTEFSAAYAAPAAPPRVGRRGPARHPRPAPVLRGARRAVRRGRRWPRWRSTGSGGPPAYGRGGTRDEDFDWQPHIPRTTPEGMDADIAAGIAYLRERTGADLPVVTVGFCFGGSHSWRQSGGDLDLAGCAGFYGKPSVGRRRGRPGAPAHGDADRRRRRGDAGGGPARAGRDDARGRRRRRRGRLRRRAALVLRPGLRRVGRGLPRTRGSTCWRSPTGWRPRALTARPRRVARGLRRARRPPRLTA